MEHPKYAVYILYSLKDHKFYTGYTANFARRLEEHSQGKCISTVARRPFIPILCEYYLTKADALRRVLYFKTSAGKRTLRLMLRESLKEIEQIKL